MAIVVAVEDRQLTAKWPQKQRVQRPSPYIQQSDRAIMRAVEDALLMDPRVNAANPNVSAINGVVTLSGIVDTLYAKRAAEADALNTTGVWKVDNQIHLRYRAFPADGEVEGMIRDVFKRDAELHKLDLGVDVADNHVRLSGSVKTMGQKIRAENIASQIEGVFTLENRIRVAPYEKTTSDSDIAAAIEDELFWSPYVDSNRITVTVTDGRALLKGGVTNRFVGRIAVQNAFEGGAQTVQTQLALNDGGTFAERFLEKPASSGLDAALELWR
jgi:osmotically-inducible protein OsmY